MGLCTGGSIFIAACQPKMLRTRYSHFQYLDIKMLHQLNIYQQAKELSDWQGMPSNRRSQWRRQGRQRHCGTWGETGHHSKPVPFRPLNQTVASANGRKFMEIHSLLNDLKMLNWEQSLQTKTSRLLTRHDLICTLLYSKITYNSRDTHLRRGDAPFKRSSKSLQRGTAQQPRPE